MTGDGFRHFIFTSKIFTIKRRAYSFRASAYYIALRLLCCQADIRHFCDAADFAKVNIDASCIAMSAGASDTSSASI